MLKYAAIILSLLCAINNSNSIYYKSKTSKSIQNEVIDKFYIYKYTNRTKTVCEADKVYNGVYTTNADLDLDDFERKTVPQDIYITYLTQDSKFPSDFMILCQKNDKIPLIVLRPTDYSHSYVNRLASKLAQYNAPVFLQVDCSNSPKYKDFFRYTADIIHLKAPTVAVVWGIADEKVSDISTYYPGDSYVDWVALNLFEGADKNGIKINPYPLYTTLSYFEKSKPIMLNLSVASYTDDGHKYYAYEAAREIERIYKIVEQNAGIRAVNYISKSNSKGNAALTNSKTVIDSFKCCCRINNTNYIRVPTVVYKYNDSFYCEKGNAATSDEYCIINGKRLYKMIGNEKYKFLPA